MKTTLEENVEIIIDNIVLAANRGAEIALFPELTVTGFHKAILAECEKAKRSDIWLDKLCEACAANHLTAFVGAPSFDSSVNAYNSSLVIDKECGLIAKVDRIGLMPSEKLSFCSGTTRPILALYESNIAVAPLAVAGQLIIELESWHVEWIPDMDH